MNESRVSALEDLLARVRRNAQEPRTSMAPELVATSYDATSYEADAAPAPSMSAASLSAPLELDPLSDAFDEPFTVGAQPAPTERGPSRLESGVIAKSEPSPPPSARSLEALTLHRRGTPPQPASVRGGSPRPPTPMPPAMHPIDSSPLHDAVISHTATSPTSGRIENGFGLVPPPPRRPSAMPDFVDEATATGDPDEAEQLLLNEQEEAARQQRVRFPTPPVPRMPTPLPPAPPLTLREPPRSPGSRPVLELDDLDLSSVSPGPDSQSAASLPEPTRPFGYDPDGDRERGAIAHPTEQEISEPARVDALSLQEQLEVDGAKTDRPPEIEPRVDLPPVSTARLPDVGAIEDGALSAQAALAVEEEQIRADASSATRASDQAPEAASEDPLFDAPSFESPYDFPTVDTPKEAVPPETAGAPVHREGLEPAPSFDDASADEERSPSSSRQIRDEVRPLDDQFDGFGPVGDSEPPPESGEIPSQRYGTGEGIAARGTSAEGESDGERPSAFERSGASAVSLFENPSTEDDARSGVVVARISSAPLPVSDPHDGPPQKPARIERPDAGDIALATTAPVPSIDATALAQAELAAAEKTTEVQSVGRVDVFERSAVEASGPISLVAGERPDHESFGAIVDASIAIGL